jgi:ABC-type uncharacterized transport system permease subunit
MSSMPVGVDPWADRRDIGDTTGSKIPLQLATASFILRTIFLVSLLIVTIHVSAPQTSTLWTVFQTPGDLIRLTLGFAVCFGIAVQVFSAPKDAHAHRTWLYLGLAMVPFTLICIVGIW